jgi:hypothetical protein
MQRYDKKQSGRIKLQGFGGLVLVAVVLLFGTAPRKVHANIYATNIRLNGATNNLILPTGDNLTIDYILNEEAVGGVTIRIATPYRLVRRIIILSGPGTWLGPNSVVWDGFDDQGQSLPNGIYFVSVTAATSGYSDWTQTSRDWNSAAYVANGRGLAINRNTNSLYYGRIFVANAAEGPYPNYNSGDRVGILKANADGSFAEDGEFSTGSYPWDGNFFSPWKLDVGSDDWLYVDDFSGAGVVISFDQLVSSNGGKMVLRGDNYYTSSPLLSGPTITGSATTLQVWMADMTQNGGLGVHRWDITSGGIVAPNDLGVTAVETSPYSDLDTYPFDVALDPGGNIYTVQNRITSNDPTARMLRFPASPGIGETLANWKTGSGDNSMGGAHGIAVSPDGVYLAVAFRGVFNGSFQNGAARIFYASNGAPVTTLTPGAGHDHRDVAWDNVGNVYAIDNYDQVWRCYSPPGANISTTVAAQSIQIIGNPAQPPILTSPHYGNGQFSFTLNGEPDLAYIVLSSTDLSHWSPVATNIAATSVRNISVTTASPQNYFRILTGP